MRSDAASPEPFGAGDGTYHVIAAHEGRGDRNRTVRVAICLTLRGRRLPN